MIWRRKKRQLESLKVEEHISIYASRFILLSFNSLVGAA